MATRTEVREIRINGQQPAKTLKNLSAEARKLKREIRGAEEGTEKFIRANKRLGEVNKQMAGITQRATELQGGGSSGVSGITKSFGKLKAGAVAAIGAITGALVKLAIHTDRTARETLKLRDAITTLTGTTGKELDTVASQVQALSKRFDKDFNEVIKASINFSKQFGISQQESLNLIEKGFLKGADLSGDFLDQIAEYPTFFKQIGATADQFIKVITAGVTEGVFSDKFPDSIKETAQRISEGTKATKDALTDAFGAAFSQDLLNRVKTGQTTILAAIQEIGEKTKASNLTLEQTAKLTADLGGGPAEDLGGFVKQTQLLEKALGSTLEATTEAEKANKGLLDSQRQIELSNQELAEEYREIAQSADESRQRFRLLVSKGIVQVLKSVKPLIKEIQNFIKQSTFLKAIVSGVQITFKFLSRVLSTAFQVIRVGFNSFVGAIRILESFTHGIINAIRNIIRFVSNLGVIQPISKKVSQAFGFLGKAIQPVIKFFQNLDKVVGGIGRTLGGLASRLGSAIKSLGSFSRSEISKSFGNLFSAEAIKKDFEKGFEEVRKANKKAQDKLTEDNKKALEKRKKNQKKNEDEQKGARSQYTQEEIKAAQDAAKKLAEERQKRIELRKAVNRRIRDLTIANIKDETTRAIAARTAAAQDEIEQLKGTEAEKALQQKLIEQQLQTDLEVIRQQAAEKKAEQDKANREKKAEQDKANREKELEEKFAQIEKDKEIAQFAITEIDEAEREIRTQTAEQFFEFEKARLEALFQVEQVALQRKLALAAGQPKLQATINKQIEAGQKKHTDDLNKLDTRRVNYKKQLEAQTMGIISGGIQFLEAAFGKNEALTKASLVFDAAAAISKIIQNGAIEQAKLAATVPFPANIPLVAAAKIRQGIQIGTVVASKAPKILGERGGMLQGPRHNRGGIPGTGAFANIEVEGGEVILSRATVANNRELVGRLLNASLNEGGRRIMQDGGVLPTAAPGNTPSTAGVGANPQSDTNAIDATAQAQAQMTATLEEIKQLSEAQLAFMEANASLYRKAFVSFTDLRQTAQQAQAAEDDNSLQ